MQLMLQLLLVLLRLMLRVKKLLPLKQQQWQPLISSR